MTTNGTGCDGPGREVGTECGREVLAKGLCSTHHRQLLRFDGNRSKLRPIREGDLVKLPGTALRVKMHTARVVRREAKRLKVTHSDVVRQVVDGWAAQQG